MEILLSFMVSEFDATLSLPCWEYANHWGPAMRVSEAAAKNV